MKQLSTIFVLLIAAIIAFPFILSINLDPVQSYPDFFIKGAHNALLSLYSWSSQNFGQNVGGSVWRLFPFGLLYLLLTNVLDFSSGFSQLIVCSFLFLLGYIFYCKMVPSLLSVFRPSNIAVKISGLFYIFNPYTLVQFTNSFLLVIPYLLLPLQIHLLLRAFNTRNFKKYIVLLGLVNASCFGINLIFSVIAIFVLVSVAIYKLHIFEKIPLKNLALFLTSTYALTFLLSSFWLVPQIYSSLTDPATTQFVLQSEQFYNSDSSIFNVLRGLGEWGFFSSQNGIPYNSFSTAFRSNPFVIISGFMIFALALSSLYFYRAVGIQRKSVLSLLAALMFIFIIMVGTYPGFPTAPVVAQVFEKVPFAMAFRNTYKFGSIEMLLISLLVAVSITNILKLNISKYKLVPIGVCFGIVSIIMINAFPFFTKQIYSLNSQIQDIPNYWRETAQVINKDPSLNQNYVFMLPDQYFEVFRWDGKQKSFSRNLEETLFKPSVVHNTCKGCSQQLTSDFITYSYNNLSKSGVFDLLGLVGNSAIVQRNDYDSKYYKVQSPQQIKVILANDNDVSLRQSIGLLDIYDINKSKVNSYIYSPEKLIATNTIDAFPTIASRYDKNTSLILTETIRKGDKKSFNNSNFYQPIFNAKTSEVYDGIKANSKINIPRKDNYRLSSSANDTNYRVGFKYVNNSYILTLQKLDSVISVDNKQLSIKNTDSLSVDLGSTGPKPIIVELNKRAFLLDSNKARSNIGTISTGDSDNSIKVYDTENVGANLVKNSSLEQGLWQSKVENCALTATNADINMKLINENASDGKKALSLSSNEDSACTYTPPLDNFQSGSYFFSFDSKNIRGSAPSYCVWDGKECVDFSNVGLNKNWATFSQAVYLNRDASNFYLYLYAQNSNGNQTENYYDNVKVYRLTKPLKSINYSLPLTNIKPVDFNLDAGEHNITSSMELSPVNLVDNGNFKEGPWQKTVNNCSDRTGVANLKMKTVYDNEVGDALLLSTDGSATACTNSSFIGNYNKGNTYALTFRYKVIKGTNARICIWNGQTCISTKSVISSDRKWHSASELVVAEKGFQPLSVYLYASEGQQTEVAYANVDLRQIENSFVNLYSLENTNLHKIKTADISFNQDSPTRYNAIVKTKSLSLIALSQSYHPKWKAYAVSERPHSPWDEFKWSLGLWDRYQIPDNNHTVTNGFANGWWIDPSEVPINFQVAAGEYNVIIDYGPQNLVNIGLVVSGVTLASCLIFIGIPFDMSKGYFAGRQKDTKSK